MHSINNRRLNNAAKQAGLRFWNAWSAERCRRLFKQAWQAFKGKEKPPEQDEHHVTVSTATFDRMRNPSRGRGGGQSGTAGTARLASGRKFSDKAIHTIFQDDRFSAELPGGGGLGDPHERREAMVRTDLEAGYPAKEGAKKTMASYNRPSTNTVGFHTQL